MTDDTVGGTWGGACGLKCSDGTWGAGCTLQCADPKKLSKCDLGAAGMLVCSPHPPRRPGPNLGALLRDRASTDTRTPMGVIPITPIGDQPESPP